MGYSQLGYSGCFVFRQVQTLSDLLFICDFIGALFEPVIPSSDDRFKQIISAFPQDRSLMITAMHANDCVGAVLSFSKGEGVVVRMIGVHPRFRRIGVAQRLLELIEIGAMQRGAGMISLGALPSAKGFYERLGYSGKSSMHKGLPAPSRVLDFKLKRYVAAMGDLEAGETVCINPVTKRLPSLL